MRYLKEITASLVLFAVSITCSYSQSSINIHIGPSIPVSNFSLYGIGFGSNPTIMSTPKIGIATGIKYVYTFPDRRIGFFMGLDFLYNKPNNEYIDSIKSMVDSYGYDILELPKYYNIPISLGFNYQYPIIEKLSINFDLGISMNFLKITDMAVENWPRSSSDWANSIGAKIGAGLIFKDIFLFQLNYFALGNHEVTTKFENDPEDNLTSTKELNVHFLSVTAGICF